MLSRFKLWLKKSWPIAAIGSFAFAIILVRATHQSITWDEAATFLLFVWQRDPSLWYADPNNHVLNSMLESLFVHAFGASGFTVRFPTMLGALVYIVACSALCSRYIRDRTFSWIAFACLVLNPFVLDYCVAARGYGLALAFLMSEIYFLSVAREDGRSRFGNALLASLAGGLSIASNFSFGVAAVVALGVFGVIFALDKTEHDRIRLGLALVIPAPLVALCICGPALTTFNSKRELVFGATSVGQMLASIVSNSFDGPNLSIVNPNVLPVVLFFRSVDPAAIGLLLAAANIFLISERSAARNPSIPIVIILFGTIAIETVLASISHTPLPLNRTILFAAPLATVALCFSASAVRTRWFVRAATAVMGATAIFFLFSTRMYFREWAFDSNVLPAYTTLSRIEEAHPQLTVVTNFNYFFGLNFYQAVDTRPAFPPIVKQLPANDVSDTQAVYVLSKGDDDAFVAQHGLKIVSVFPGQDSPDTEIAVKPDVRIPALPRPPIDHVGGS